jgi:thiol-disulfide isomerase/thioredoxin
MKKVLVFLVTIIMLSGCRIEKINTMNVEAKVFSKEYNIRENNVFVNASVNDILNIFKKGSGIIYFGNPSSPFCQEVVKILDEISKENDINQIYYLNIEEVKRENLNDYQKIYDLVKDHLEYTDDKGNLIIYSPDVYFVKDGKIIGNHITTNKAHDELVKEEGKWIDLTKKEKDELKYIYLGLLSKVYSCDYDSN